LLSDGSFIPSAIFALNDIMAIGALMAAEELRYEVPKQLSIIGIDGIDLGNVVRPRLSTLVLPIHEIGIELFSMLHSRMKGEYSGPSRHQVFTGRLVIRESTFKTNSI
jgi:DNA-binding LacI/PurR family transcriptional regulator